MFNRILVVCSGNICRSPLAKILFEKHLPSKQVDSAGLYVASNQLTNRCAHPSAIQVANTVQLDLSNHRAKQISPDLVEASDLILVMSHQHAEEIHLSVKGARSKTLLIGQWLGIGEIEDPICGDAVKFAECFATLEKCVLSWKKRIEVN
ncbi:hypothetical protein BIY22_16445 [Vibrio panuliri]|uniref:protein-tyrosine-phosphatase n=1 Tax=Vibrio panuliri TaxID=1381081 RepID=A0A1Q9HMW6_9VIBR|nr:low molecular weight protein-tyrosine-phosphatase [Vibrio panuliri]OLQ92099.1 hypothetical protein BIY22_16445 [Vibrio panuliri]